MTILGISGSLRAGSHNSKLLRLVAEELPAATELRVFDGLAQIPPYDQDQEHDPPAAVVRLKREIAAADVVLLASPEYNGSIPGQLKNALDWVSRPVGESPVRGKPFAVIGASTGSFGGVWAQAELRKVVGLMGARVLDVELGVGKAHERLEEPDDALRASLHDVSQALVGALAEAVAA